MQQDVTVTLVLFLEINNSSHNVYTDTSCVSYDWNGTTYTSSGTYTYNYINGSGCASTDTLHLIIESTNNVYTETACNSYLWNDSTYTESGTYTYNYINGFGCASTDTLYLTINNSTYNTYVETGCDSYVWNDSTYTSSGTYTYNYTNGTGCASTDTLYLTINNSTHNVYADTSCNSYVWNDSTYTESGTYTYNYINGSGCASTDTLYLTINNSTHNVLTVSSCNNYVWNDSTYTNSGTYTYNYTNGSGCASTDTLYLTIYNSTYNAYTATGCDSFVWNDSTYTSSGIYTHNYTNGSGCASTDTLHLTINNSSTGDTTVTTCGSFTWYGTTYYSSGTPTYVLQNAAGCDSIVTLNLTINQLPAVTVTGDSVCEGSSGTLTANASGVSYLWNTGDTTQSINVSDSLTYYVTVTDSITSCQNVASGSLMILIQPTVSCSGDQEVCDGSEVCFTGTVVSGMASDYYWNNDNADTVASYDYTLCLTASQANAGSYSFIALNYCGGDYCLANLTVDEPPQVSCSGNQEVCAGTDVCFTGIINAGTEPIDYYWLDSLDNIVSFDSSLCLTANAVNAGIYTFYAENACGNSSCNSILTTDQAPVVSCSGDQEVCSGTNVCFTGDYRIRNLSYRLFLV